MLLHQPGHLDEAGVSPPTVGTFIVDVAHGVPTDRGTNRNPIGLLAAVAGHDPST
jgi:hypothetical protein